MATGTRSPDRELCVRGGAARPPFEYAADHPADALANLEHLTVEDWAPEPYEAEQLTIWLAARAETARGASSPLARPWLSLVRWPSARL
jgi:hypothetical protein